MNKRIISDEQAQMDEKLRKLMSGSQKSTKYSMSIWQFNVILAIFYLIGLVISHNGSELDNAYWSGFELSQESENGEWVASNRFDIGKHETLQKVRFSVAIDDSEKWQRPVGLMIGGPFSANVFWDGNDIGAKGKASSTSDSEVPGLIDEIFFVPQSLLSPGNHTIEVWLSTHHLMFDDASVFHFISLGPYRENGRRDLRYYATPLIVLSALLLLSFQSFRIGHNAGNPVHTGLGTFGFFVIVLLISEISRALINYQYHYHELRGILGWLGNTGAGLSLVFTCYKLIKSKALAIVLIVATLLVFTTYFIALKSGDLRRAMEFILLCAAPALVFTIMTARGQVSYLSTLPLFVIACVVSTISSTAFFLDSFQFVAALILIGGAWAWVYVETETPVANIEQSEACSEFSIKRPDGVMKVSVQDCFALKGEGNYTTLLLTNGEQLLHQDGIGAIMDTSPNGFVRVHKSYAVNIKYAKQLKSAPGSKYWLEMAYQDSIPVSRYRAVEVRHLLQQE